MKIRISGKAFGVIEGSELYHNPDKYTQPGTEKYAGAVEVFNCIGRKSGDRSRWVKAGRGQSLVIDDISPEGVWVLEDYLRTMAETFMGGGFDDDGTTYDEGYACMEVANRLRKQLEELQ